MPEFEDDEEVERSGITISRYEIRMQKTEMRGAANKRAAESQPLAVQQPVTEPASLPVPEPVEVLPQEPATKPMLEPSPQPSVARVPERTSEPRR